MLKNKIMFPLTSTNILYQRSLPYPSDIFFHESVTFNLSSLHWTYTHVIHKITLPIKAQNISLTNDVFHGTHFPSSSTPSMSHRRPCVSHKGTKDSATVTDWMLHTARVSETQAHFLCGRGSFIIPSRWTETDRPHWGSVLKRLQHFLLSLSCLSSYLKDNNFFVYFTVTSIPCCLKLVFFLVVFIVTSLGCDRPSHFGEAHYI